MQRATVLDEVAKGEFHQPGALKCERLFELEPRFFADLRREVNQMVDTAQPSNPEDPTHHSSYSSEPYGGVVQFSLLNKTGDFNDTASDVDGSIHGKSFHHRKTFPTIAAFIDLFPHAINMRINGLPPSGGFSAHAEQVSRRNGRAYHFKTRFHLPIETNDASRVLLEDEIFHFDVGSIYYFNNGCVHAVENKGQSRRLHLIWDMLLTEETIDLMFGDTSHGPLLRPSREDRRVLVLGSSTPDDFIIQGACKSTYELLRLKSLGIKQRTWQTWFSNYSYARYKMFGHPAPDQPH